MILVEGPDGAGKTTLVERLSKMYGLRIGERGTTNRDLLYTVTVADTMRALSEAVHGKTTPILWDRLYYSDFVYAPLSVTPREVSFNASHQTHIDKIIEALRCPVIVCLPPWPVVEHNIADERHQMPGVKERAKAIYLAYNDMTYSVGDADKPFPDHRLVYDYTGARGNTWEVILDEIEDYMEERDERQP